MNPFEQVFGGAFANTVYGRAVRQQQEAFNAEFAGGLGGGRRVDARVQDEMLIRRTGNICLVAQADGWKIQRQFMRAPFGEIAQFAFVRPGKLVRGQPHQDRRQALINATEALSKLL